VDAAIYGRLPAGWYERWPGWTDYESEVDQLVEVCAKEDHVSTVHIPDGTTGRYAELLAGTGFDVTSGDDDDVDAVIMTLPVFGYQGSDHAVRATLAAAHRRLRPEGLLLLDILDSSAIIRRESLGGFAPVATAGGWLVRSVTGSVDVEEQVVRANVRLWLVNGERMVDHTEQSHYIRFFLPRELELLLELGGFQLLDTTPVAGGTREWSRLAVARRT
jgi:hypothetical protein